MVKNVHQQMAVVSVPVAISGYFWEHRHVRGGGVGKFLGRLGKEW